MEYITNIEKITACGVLRLPAIVIIGKVVTFGNALNAAEAENLLKG